ncbi:MAG: WG repeat-containing protein [Bacteroidota bacterium]
MREGFAFVLLLWLCSAQAADYQLFYENGKAGLRNDEGKVILPASFDALGWSDGNFSVINQVTGYRQNGQWGLINLKKEFVTPANYEVLTSAGGDRVVAARWINPYTKKFGCLNLEGKVTVPFHYDGISIRGLRAIVLVKNGARYEYGLIDLNDNRILPLQFRDIRHLGPMRLAVQNFEKKTALYSEDGVQLTPFSIDSIAAFRKGKAIVYQDFKQGIINHEGVFEKQPTYREIKIRDNGTITARLFDEWFLLAPDNQVKAVTNADQITPSDTEYLVSMAGKQGTVNTSLETKIALQYDYIGAWQNKLAVAAINHKYGLIHASGKNVFPFDFDTLVLEKNFVRGGTKKFGEWQWALYDTFGIKKSEKFYQLILPWNGKFFPVVQRGYTGAMNRYGQEILSCVYDSIIHFNHALVHVEFKNQFGIIDFEEKWRVAPQAHNIQLVNEYLYLEKADSITFVKNLAGETIYFTGNQLLPTHEHFEERLPDGELKFISFSGLLESVANGAVDLPTEKIFEESEGFRGIYRDGRYGFIDARGRLRVANRYEGIGKFQNGMAPVKILGRWGFVNKEDQIVINPNYESVTDFDKGVAIAYRNGKAGLIDAEGKTLLPFRYDSIFSQGDALVVVSAGKKGLADRLGNVLIEPRFDELYVLPNQQVLAKDEKYWGTLTRDGLSIIPMKYHQLTYDAQTGNFMAHLQAPWQVLSAN